eukprot:12393568-Alexandrium_andersonii.AAC.1
MRASPGQVPGPVGAARTAQICPDRASVVGVAHAAPHRAAAGSLPPQRGRLRLGPARCQCDGRVPQDPRGLREREARRQGWG